MELDNTTTKNDATIGLFTSEVLDDKLLCGSGFNH